MKNFKPAINERYSDYNKLYIIKLAEDINIDGNAKTIKYEIPVFGTNSRDLQK